ncbi:uncharacterized protein LOC134237868 [Saccostrea cucullata]|uniref:uncharacterized protein LOC134237868 n=1 Tax=Saccostrea cuccullata TaxID=36930 RepID=UPI002ED358EA
MDQYPNVFLCYHDSRVQEDILKPLQESDRSGKPILVVGIQPCEKTINPSRLLKNNILCKEQENTYFTDIIFSDSSEDCYLCKTNLTAAEDINEFCKPFDSPEVDRPSICINATARGQQQDFMELQDRSGRNLLYREENNSSSLQSIKINNVTQGHENSEARK